MIKQEISRRARVNRIKDILDCYYDVRHSSQIVANWFYHKLGVEWLKGNDDESEWYCWKCAIISDFEGECE